MKIVIILFIILAIIFIVILKLISKIEKELEEIRNNFNKEETHTIKIEDSKNFGSVTNESEAICNEKSLWKIKQ